jgi:hypothetical protein
LKNQNLSWLSIGEPHAAVAVFPCSMYMSTFLISWKMLTWSSADRLDVKYSDVDAMWINPSTSPIQRCGWNSEMIYIVASRGKSKILIAPAP